MLSYIKEIVEQRGIFLCNLGTKYSRRQDSVDLNLLRNSALCFFTDRATGASILPAIRQAKTTKSIINKSQNISKLALDFLM